MIIRFLSALALCLMLSAAPLKAAPEKDGKKASFDFGYALQAMAICDKILMRSDTEKKVEAKFGISIRGPGAPFKDAYYAGVTKANSDEGKGLCYNAWKWYGCSGTRHPKLLIENPFGNKNAKVCPY